MPLWIWRNINTEEVGNALVIVNWWLAIHKAVDEYFKGKTDGIAYAKDLVVTSDAECSELLLTHWNTIVVNEGLCNDMEEDLDISNYSDLESLVIGDNSLMNVPQVIFCNLTVLNNITIGDNALKNVPQVIFRNLPVLKTVTIGDNVFVNAKRVVVDSNYMICEWIHE